MTTTNLDSVHNNNQEETIHILRIAGDNKMASFSPAFEGPTSDDLIDKWIIDSGASSPTKRRHDVLPP
jgi:hypothetical protein